MDFAYLMKVVELNAAALAALASAPPPPDDPEAYGAVQTLTTIHWRLGKSPGAKWIAHWRATDANLWQIRAPIGSPVCQEGGPPALRQCEVKLPHIRVDDWVFGVSSVSKDGWESPVASAVPGGAFKPYVAPEKK